MTILSHVGTTVNNLHEGKQVIGQLKSGPVKGRAADPPVLNDTVIPVVPLTAIDFDCHLQHGC